MNRFKDELNYILKTQKDSTSILIFVAGIILPIPLLIAYIIALFYDLNKQIHILNEYIGYEFATLSDLNSGILISVMVCCIIAILFIAISIFLLKKRAHK